MGKRFDYSEGLLAGKDWGPGYVVDGKYELTEKLGEGGMGSVWRAQHRTLNSPVAVKLLDPNIAKTDEGLARFLREAQAAAALRSSHVVQTFDYGVADDTPFIVMELLVGESLSSRLAKVGSLSARQTALLLKQVGRAVAKAHQAGIVHRDLKPDNVFLVESDGDEFTAKVLDFGIAKSTSPANEITGSKTRTGALLGTPYYMSPEQAQGIREVDYRTDLWALAILAFECLSGQRPFDSEALGDLLLKICAAPMPSPSAYGITLPGFDEWFARAANRDPEKRFASASDQARAFALLADPTRATFSDTHRSFAPSLSGVNVAAVMDSFEGAELSTALSPTRARRRLFLGAALGLSAIVLVIWIAARSHEEPHAASASGGPASTAAATALAQPEGTTGANVEPSPGAAPSAEQTARQSAEPEPARLTKPAAKSSAPAHKDKHSATFDPLSMRR